MRETNFTKVELFEEICSSKVVSDALGIMFNKSILDNFFSSQPEFLKNKISMLYYVELFPIVIINHREKFFF